MNVENVKIEIRECTTLEELLLCQELQKKVFGLPDIEISPVRHLVVTRSAGGFILGAFDAEKLVGFVLSVPGFDGGHEFFYSHMTAVAQEYQNFGIGAKLKWAQREFALRKGVSLIKWTFQPILARNAYFNLNRLGATIQKYIPNFYGTDYYTKHLGGGNFGLDSDRLYADWNLTSEKVESLANGETYEEKSTLVQAITVPVNWDELVKSDIEKAIAEQSRVKRDFQKAFAENLICRSFERSETAPKYLLYAA